MDVVRSFMPLVIILGILMIGLKIASTESTGFTHFCHLVGVPPQDRERVGRAAGLCFAAAGAAVSLVGCTAGVVAVPYFQFVRPRGFRK